MKRTTLASVLLACGLLAAATPTFAQSATESSNWFTGKATLLLLGRDDVSSSKFTEYREVPKGVSMSLFSLQGSQDGQDFALFGQNISRSDQRYTGWAGNAWAAVSFDYNQVPHQMGNDGRTLFSETAPGVWSMSATLRKTLGDSVDAVATSGRTYAFYSSLLAPTIASAGSVDLDSLRQRGNVEVDLGKKLPFDLTLTYMREVKTGARGASGGDILGVVTSAIDVPETFSEVVQDFGIRWAYAFKSGNVHATFNRNLFNDRQNSLVIDNPFRGSDLAYTSTSVPGGPGQVRFGTAPDNEASRGAAGFLLKFKRQTRLAGEAALGRWTQNAAFLPFTINSAILTPAGASANSLAALPRASLDGKINTTMLNFSFTSRPVDDLAIRLRYRSYELDNKTTPPVFAGSTSGSPDRSWTTTTASADAPYGYATANPVGTKTARFDGQVSYDISDLTVEAAVRHAKLDRTYREATSGDENGYAFSAVFHANDWVGVRGVYDRYKRTAKGWDPATSIGLQADEAEKETTRTGVDIEITPWSKIGLTFAYFRRDDDYPNRPTRVAGNPDTTVGLLEAKYDTYTAEVDVTPSERAEFSAFYTYEKNATSNRWVTLTSGALNNQLRYDGSDRGDTFGAHAVIHVVPEKWTLSARVSHQKVDGLMDITAREAGSFYTPGRTGVVPAGTGGAQDITDFDDTEWTTAGADLACSVTKAVTFGVGYAYDKYSHADAFSDGTTIFPQSVLFFLKANDGGYTASLVYARLNYSW